MAKKKQNLSPEELLGEALVPEHEWPYKVPENWVWVKFGELATDMADGPFGSNLKREHYTDNEEVRIIQLSNIGEEGWRDENVKYTTFEHLKTISRSKINPGEIVIAKMMPAGRSIIVPNLEKAYVLSSDAIKFVPHKELNTKYLLYAMNRTDFRNQISSETQGITRARTSIGKIKTYAFPLSPLAEQQRIVNRIESLFEKLDQAKGLIQNALDSFENRKAAILHKAFSGELTRNWREENGVGMESWSSKKIKDVCKISSGGTPSRAVPNYFNGSIPWIKTGEIKWNYITDSEEKITHEAICNSSAKIVPKGAVLLAMYGQGLTRGRAAILDVEATTNQAVCVLLPNNGLLNKYLYYFFMCNYWSLREEAVGGNQPNFSGKLIGEFALEIPSAPEQVEIINILDNLLGKENTIVELCDIIVNIDSMKKSILSRAFRGELGTNDPEEESAMELLKSILVDKINTEQPITGEVEKIKKERVLALEEISMSKTIIEVLSEYKSLTPEKLKALTGIKDIEDFYAELKNLVDTGAVIDRREGDESYLEVNNAGR